MGLQAGSNFLAPQTLDVLQAVALATIVVTVSKDQGLAPWSHGHARLSEISIEEFFGQCRAQSNNSQLTTRGYFQASALLSMKASKQLNQKDQRRRPSEKGLSEQPLTSEQSLRRTMVGHDVEKGSDETFI